MAEEVQEENVAPIEQEQEEEIFTAEQQEHNQNIFHYFSKEGEQASIATKDVGPYLRCLGLNPTETEIQHIINAVDPDNSQVCTYYDLQKWIYRKMQDTDTEEQLMEAFKVFDPEGKNFLRADELRHIMTNLGDKMTEEEVDEMIKEADPDNNLLVKYEDFAKYMISK